MEESFIYNYNCVAEVEDPVADSVHGFFDPVDSQIFFDPVDSQNFFDPVDSQNFFDPVDSQNFFDSVDSHLPLDTLFQNNVDSLFCSASLPLSSFSNGEGGGYSLPLPSFSDSTILSFPPPPPSDNSTSLHDCLNSDFYIQDQPPPLSEPIPFYYPIVDPTILVEFVAPSPPTMAVVLPIANGGSSLSLQTVAARERRKRISQKTQKLGQLIPGGNRMNTAEMLQAALKYVKFLQAQVDVLRHMVSIPGCSSVQEHLQVLLASPAIQERLSAEEMCIVPKEMLDKN